MGHGAFYHLGADVYFAFEEVERFGEAFAEADAGFSAEENTGLGDVGAAAGGVVLRQISEAELTG